MMFLSKLPPQPVAQVQREENYLRLYRRRDSSSVDTLVSGGNVLTPVPEYATSASPARNVAARQSTTPSRLIAQIKIVRTPFRDLIIQLAECLQDARDGMDVSQGAAARVFNLLSETQRYLCRDGDLYPDGDGGLRVEWEHGARQIRLAIHASDEREDYLYWQEGKKHFIETPVTAKSFIKWQNWLRGRDE